jgi:hypothetical protein
MLLVQCLQTTISEAVVTIGYRNVNCAIRQDLLLHQTTVLCNNQGVPSLMQQQQHLPAVHCPHKQHADTTPFGITMLYMSIAVTQPDLLRCCHAGYASKPSITWVACRQRCAARVPTTQMYTDNHTNTKNNAYDVLVSTNPQLPPMPGDSALRVTVKCCTTYT